MRLFLVVLSCLLGTTAQLSQPVTGSDLRARLAHEHVGEWPDSVVSWLIVHDGEWSYAIARTHTAGGKILWLERFLGRSEDGTPTWKTVDFLVLPPLDNTRHLAVGGGCFRDGVHDPALFAVVSAPGDVEEAVVVSAWRANEEAERFEAIEAAGVVCDPRSWGEMG